MKCKLLRTVCLLITTLFITHAHSENHQVFVGQVSHDGETRDVFVLDLMGNDLENHVYISEVGEIWLKADKLIALPKEIDGELLAHSSFVNSLSNVTSIPRAQADFNSPENWIRCRNCRRSFDANRYRYVCPVCNTLN